ncbi:MAG TPA: formyltetrahydrofolate deformylase [Alphaproteobacteria bacterium]|nr:formyltetrahydrofolate deformylase [Alphaproteobacteria bacterium]
MPDPGKRFILTLSCPDTAGIVHAVSGCLAERGCNIEDSAQFWDRGTGLFFMRVAFDAGATAGGETELAAAFAPVAERFGMDWKLADAAVRPRVLIMVSRLGHCLNDLLYRYQLGALPMEVPAIVSNHRDFYRLAASYDIPFHHLPVTPENKAQQEARLLELIDELRIDTVVLARYMQVLSDDLCTRLPGRVINIHHSFLPSFKGAKPYHQAHARGVKLIGATAHYVTADLDEGPIIEQEVARVDHAMTPEDLVAVGRDVESVVLARAVKYHLERRVLLDGNKTVVFR